MSYHSKTGLFIICPWLSPIITPCPLSLNSQFFPVASFSSLWKLKRSMSLPLTPDMISYKTEELLLKRHSFRVMDCLSIWSNLLAHSQYFVFCFFFILFLILWLLGKTSPCQSWVHWHVFSWALISIEMTNIGSMLMKRESNTFDDLLKGRIIFRESSEFLDSNKA